MNKCVNVCLNRKQAKPSKEVGAIGLAVIPPSKSKIINLYTMRWENQPFSPCMCWANKLRSAIGQQLQIPS